MLFACFWLLLWRPRTQLGATLAALFIVATALSNPGVWFFVPVAALRALAIRDRRDATIVAGFFLGGAIQALALAASSYQAVQPVWTADIWTVLLQRVVDGGFLGLRLGGAAWELLGWAALAGLAIAAVAGLAAGLRSSSRGTRYLAALAVPTALGMFVISVYQRAVGTPMLWPADAHNGSAGRYSIVPVLLLIGVALALIENSRGARRQRAGQGRSWLAIGAVALMLVSVAASFPEADRAARGTPPWDAALDGAASACTSDRLAEVPIAVSPPPFGMQLPCSTIPGAGDPAPPRR
jgi:hypothetical protein